MGATKSGRDLPLYEIGVLLKIGGTGSYYACLLQNHLTDSRAVRVVEFSDLFINWRGGSNPDRAHFFHILFFCVFFFFFNFIQ